MMAKSGNISNMQMRLSGRRNNRQGMAAVEIGLLVSVLEPKQILDTTRGNK